MAGPTQVVRTTVARRATTPNALLQSAEIVPSDGMMPAPGAGGHGFGEEQGREDSGTRTTGGAPGRTRTSDPRLRRGRDCAPTAGAPVGCNRCHAVVPRGHELTRSLPFERACDAV